MRKSTFSRLLFFSLVLVITLQSCKNDVYLATTPPVKDGSFTESFDTLQNAYDRGWRFINRSDVIGVTNWEQGSIGGALFPYKSLGTNLGFITSDYQATAGDANTISNWAVSPVVTFQNGDKIVFYTICQLYALSATDSTDFANRLQVRFSTKGESLDVGDKESVGAFTEGLIDINPNYLEHHSDPALFNPTAYPSTWTRFEGTVSGLNGPVKGRFAIRSFLEGAGIAGRGSEIGVDEVSYISASH